jgi:hypothetical protein
MKIIRARTPRGDWDLFDADKLKEVDEREGRRRLSGGEIEALIGVTTGINIIRRSIICLEELAKETGQQRRAKLVETMVLNLLTGIARKVAQDQLITIGNNVYDVVVTLSSSGVDGCVNIRWKDMQVLADNVLLSCSMSCGKSRDESKSCPIRRALENVPGLKAAAKSQGNTKDCPFSGLEMEWGENI